MKGSELPNPILNLRLVFIPSTHDLPSNSRVKAHVKTMCFDLSVKISPLNIAMLCLVKLSCSSSTELEAFSGLLGYALACLLSEHRPGARHSDGIYSLSLCAGLHAGGYWIQAALRKENLLSFSLVVSGQARPDHLNPSI